MSKKYFCWPAPVPPICAPHTHLLFVSKAPACCPRIRPVPVPNGSLVIDEITTLETFRPFTRGAQIANPQKPVKYRLTIEPVASTGLRTSPVMMAPEAAEGQVGAP